MKNCLISLLAIIAIASAIPTKIVPDNDAAQRNAIIEQIVLQALESVREIMVTGSDDVPVLDPLRVDKLVIDDNILGQIGIYNSHITLENILVEHLSTFVIHQLGIYRPSLVALRYNVDLDFSIPTIEFSSEKYALSLNLLGFNIFGNGKMSVTLIEPRLSGRVEVPFRISITDGTTISLQSVDLKFQLKGIKPDIRGLLGDDDAVSDFVNKFLELFITDAVQLFETEISEILNSAVLEIGNQILDGLDIGSIIGLKENLIQ